MDGNKAELLDYYAYNFLIEALAPGDSDSDVQNIESESNFIWVKTSGFADIAGAAQVYDGRIVPLVTLQITDVGSGRSLMSGPTAWSNIVGWGEIPYILPIKRKWQANTSIRIEATNFDVAVTYNLRITMSGIKDFGAIHNRR